MLTVVGRTVERAFVADHSVRRIKERAAPLLANATSPVYE